MEGDKYDFPFESKNQNILGLPWWLSSKEFACQFGRHGFDPWSGKTPYVLEQLSLCPTTIEPVLWSQGTATTEPMRPRSHAPQR